MLIGREKRYRKNVAADPARTPYPALGQELLSYIITVLSERLSFACRVIRVLQR
jgi:hypothetical protein